MSISTASRPVPTIDGKGSHGGYCGPAVKPIALSMVSEIARDPECRDLPISGIGGITTWRDAAEFLALGASNVQVCTAVMTYGFKIVSEMIAGFSGYLDEKQMSLSDLVGRAVPNLSDWQYLNLNYVTKARIDQDLCIKCGRCHIVCEDTSHQAITAMKDGQRYFEVVDSRMRRLQSLRQCLPGRGLHHHGAAHRRRRSAHRRAGHRLPRLDRPPQQPRLPGQAAGVGAGPATLAEPR